MTRIFIGIDSVDSNYGGCTTHFTVFLIKMLSKKGYKLEAPPFLVRLNPSIPHKTRGNAAVSLVAKTPPHSEQPGELGNLIARLMIDYSSIETSPDKKPGLVVLSEESFSKARTLLSEIYVKALSDIIPRNVLLRKLRDTPLDYATGGLGLIGAIASLGFIAKHRKKATLELIAYRAPEMWGTKRRVRPQSVKRVCEESWPKLFNNYDFERDEAVSVPHGPDPVLIGLRGTDAHALFEAARELELGEPVYSWMLFVTNQHTDEPLSFTKKISSTRTYQMVRVKGIVVGKPVRLQGGHVLATIADETGYIQVAAYRHSGDVRKTLALLEEGDQIEVAGVIRPAPSHEGRKLLAAYKLKILELPRLVTIKNPRCSVCGKTMKSKGKGFFECPKCKHRVRKEQAVYTIQLRERTIGGGRWLTPPPGRIAHLIKPNEVTPIIIEGWNVPFTWQSPLKELNMGTVFNPFE